jgi:hypothetical protein
MSLILTCIIESETDDEERQIDMLRLAIGYERNSHSLRILILKYGFVFIPIIDTKI